MNTRLNLLALGYTGAILSSLGMFVMWVLGRMGYYTEAVQSMQDWHMFFSPSVTGLIGGVIEAAIITFVSLYAFGWIYNEFTK